MYQRRPRALEVVSARIEPTHPIGPFDGNNKTAPPTLCQRGTGRSPGRGPIRYRDNLGGWQEGVNTANRLVVAYSSSPRLDAQPAANWLSGQVVLFCAAASPMGPSIGHS